LILIAAAGCQNHAPQQPSLHDQRQAKLDEIADKCGLARNTFKLIGDRDLHIQPDSDAKYEQVDCGLTELRKANLPVNMGFIGSEYYSNEVQ
jgi:hypothetical protein